MEPVNADRPRGRDANKAGKAKTNYAKDLRI